MIKEIYGVSRSQLLHSQRLSERRLSLLQWFSLFRSSILYHLGCPYEYVWGHTEFRGRDYLVNRSVLIPRPETEEWVGKVIEHIYAQDFMNRKIKILEIGTGSGVIAITIKAEIPTVEITAVDISASVLDIAQKNAHRLLENTPEMKINPIRFLHGDIFDIPIKKLIPLGSFDIVVTNPPYVGWNERYILSRKVRKYEPQTALFAGDDGMNFYRKLVPLLPLILSEKGYFYTEVGWQQAEKVSHLFKYFSKKEIVKDMFGKDRLFIGKK